MKTRLFTILVLSSIFSVLLLMYRVITPGFNFKLLFDLDYLLAPSHSTYFLFLGWNLFLAWIPYLLSLCLKPINKYFGFRTLVIGLLGAWLLFLPNAPYILTDLLHLRHRTPIPIWYDLLMILSFAWTGLTLGLISLLEVHAFIKVVIGNTVAWMVTVSSIFLCGIGIYIGRFLRWNSWDIIIHPFDKVRLLVEQITMDTMDSNSIYLSLLLSCFLMLAFLKFYFMTSYKQS